MIDGLALGEKKVFITTYDLSAARARGYADDKSRQITAQVIWKGRGKDGS